jgi:hypothetical protein
VLEASLTAVIKSNVVVVKEPKEMKTNNMFVVAARNFAAFLCMLVVFGAMMTSCQADSESVRTEYAAPKTFTEYKTVTVQNYINSYSWFVDNTVMVNGYKAMTFDVINTYPIIEMAVDQQGMPSMTDERDTQWTWSDSQISTSSIETFGNDSLWISGSISPLYNEFEAVRLHEKVLKINAKYQMTGAFNLSNRGMVNFSQKLTRPYYQVDSSVRVDTITKTEKEIEIQFVEVEVHDTVTVEKEILREVFVAGAEVNTSISNNWGYSVATMDLGSTHLLTLNIKHSYNPITVAEYGASLTSGATAIEWFFNDSQHTTSNSSANNAKVESITWLRNETENIEGVGCLITTVFRVDGYYTNENGDKKNFSFEMKPMYLQYKEAAPAVVTPEVNTYRGIIRKVTAEGLKLMTKPVVQKWNSETGAWEDVRTCSRSCIGMSGSPSGLDLFVKSAKIIEETENSWNYSGNDATWAGDDTKSDGTIITKRTKVYEFNHMFEADAVNNGKVGPATQLYVMKAERVQVLDPENNLLTCTWEDGSEFSLNISVVLNNTEFVEKSELKGQTRKESDKTYKYLTSFVQHFTATVGGQKLQDVDATSTLWVPVE